VELAEVGRTAFEGERSLLEPAAVERLGQAIPRPPSTSLCIDWP